MKLTSKSLKNGARIGDDYAFGVPDPEKHMTFGGNRNPHLAWDKLPHATRSLAVICVDKDVPSVGDDVNQEGKTIPADLPRVDFFHWVMIDVPPEFDHIEEANCSDGVVEGGKRKPPGPKGSRQGLNDYSQFMAGSDLAGDYHGYDGPCPPWNDERLHHYHFRVYALDVERLEVGDHFDGRDVMAAIAGHVLDSAELTGTYTLNPAVMG
ncbi:MAG: YbhB/YbcL family Raf kinase inhibitor-like protein [Xanthomonadales bacterium]|nr:YbhB/YbcL family Raf kinase inhibitor-like protein [Xanthomonadales bacterium]